MRGINKVIILGHVGKDPESNSVKTGGSICTFSIATSESWKDKTTGDKQERTEWHRIVCFGQLAEIATKYVKKGHKLYVEGNLKTNKWTDKQGQERETVQIMAQTLQILSDRLASEPSAKKDEFVDNIPW